MTGSDIARLAEVIEQALYDRSPDTVANIIRAIHSDFVVTRNPPNGRRRIPDAKYEKLKAKLSIERLVRAYEAADRAEKPLRQVVEERAAELAARLSAKQSTDAKTAAF